jgi:FkbM family methyltransferase
MKRLINGLLHRLGYHITKHPLLSDFETDIAQILRDLNVDLVLDVGAHLGEFGLRVRRMGYSGRIVSFEPVEWTRQRLEVLARHDAGWTVVPCALGQRSGMATINTTADASCDSLLMPTVEVQQAPAWHGWFRVTGTEEIHIERLDTLWPELVGSAQSVFLKIDTQGYDLEVIRGAGRHLAEISAVQMEASLQPLYEGAPDFEEAVAHMRDCGFFLSALEPLYRPEKRVVELDVLFLNKQLAHGTNEDREALVRPYIRS